jgi:multidrug efflux pump subunit AcrA (membrane-fusion protein)
MSRARIVGWVFVGVGAVAAVVTLVRTRAEDAEVVRTAVVVERGITSKVVAQGKVRAKTQAEVSSEVGGRVAQVYVEVGDSVKVGDPLFALDGEQLRNTVLQLEAAIASAEAVVLRTDVAVKEAERGVARDTALFQKGVLADDALKLAETRLASATAERASATANVERTRLDLSRAKDALRRARVTSPLTGTVVAVGVEVGRVVSSGTGLSASPDAALGLGIGGASAPVIIADLSELLVKLDVDELDISRVRPGQQAIVRAQGIKDVEFSGVVDKVGLLGRDAMGAVLFSVEVKVVGSRASGSLSVDTTDPSGAANKSQGLEGQAPIVPSPAALLRPGMSAQAEIEVERVEKAIAVPLAAVLEATKSDEGEQPDRVVVVEGDASKKDAVLIASLRPVRLGPSEGETIAILSGLSVGERVVEGPYRILKQLTDGAKVTLEPEKENEKDNDGATKPTASNDDGAAKKGSTSP